jgi:hypothetical protein
MHYIHILALTHSIYEGVSNSFRTYRLERELQGIQLSATRCSCIAVLWVSLVNFAAITLCVASQWVFLVLVVYFVINSVRKLLGTPPYVFDALSSEPKSELAQCCLMKSVTQGSHIDVSFTSRRDGTADIIRRYEAAAIRRVSGLHSGTGNHVIIFKQQRQPLNRHPFYSLHRRILQILLNTFQFFWHHPLYF